MRMLPLAKFTCLLSNTMKTNIITAAVTAYCACKICCGSNARGITASGQKPIQGITVAASLPFGSSVVIQGHTYKVQDRLSKRFDKRFDIFFNSHKDALKWGKTNVSVTIIKL